MIMNDNGIKSKKGFLVWHNLLENPKDLPCDYDKPYLVKVFAGNSNLYKYKVATFEKVTSEVSSEFKVVSYKWFFEYDELKEEVLSWSEIIEDLEDL